MALKAFVNFVLGGLPTRRCTVRFVPGPVYSHRVDLSPAINVLHEVRVCLFTSSRGATRWGSDLQSRGREIRLPVGVRANSITSTGNSKQRRPPEKPAACRTHLSSPSPTTVKLACESRLMITAYREVNIWNGLFSCPHTSTMMTKFLNLGASVPTPLLNFTFSIGATCRLCGANKFKFKVPL